MRQSKAQALEARVKLLEQASTTWTHPDYEKAIHRAASMSSYAIQEWIDNTITSMGEASEDFRKAGSQEEREMIGKELFRGTSMLQALTEELLFRNGMLI